PRGFCASTTWKVWPTARPAEDTSTDTEGKSCQLNTEMLARPGSKSLGRTKTLFVVGFPMATVFPTDRPELMLICWPAAPTPVSVFPVLSRNVSPCPELLLSVIPPLLL